MTIPTSRLSDAIDHAAAGIDAALVAGSQLPPPGWTPPPPWPDELERGGFTRAGAPEDFDRVCRIAAAIESGEERNAIFLGGVGRGKTLAATIIGRRVFRSLGYEPQFKPHFLRASQFSARARDDYEDADLVAMFRTATLCDVLLDDFGADEAGRVYAVETDLCAEFFKNYCDKADSRKHCLVTTNLPDREAVRDRLGDRIFDRLLESFAWLQFKGADKRAEKARSF